MREGETTLEILNDRVRWWTFAGLRANVDLAAGVSIIKRSATQRSNLYIDLESDVRLENLSSYLANESEPSEIVEVAEWATASLKLAKVLPEAWPTDIVSRRMVDRIATEAVISSAVRRYG